MGRFVLSLDAELAWGFHDVRLPAERLERTRRVWQDLLDRFEAYEIPATWAVVGHLLLDSCEVPHYDHPAGLRPCEVDAHGLPAENAWFGTDLVAAVDEASVDHEIAGHGFTHVHFGHEQMSRAFARNELTETKYAAEHVGCDVETFVFPVNEVAYRKLLLDCGYDCYRGRSPVADDGPRMRRARKAAHAVLGSGHPPLVTPDVDEYGLVNVPASMYLFDLAEPLESLVEPIHGDPVVERAKRGIDAAAEGGPNDTFHLWVHPHDLTEPMAFARLMRVLDHVARRRDEGDLRVETMGTVADRVRAEVPA